ncbi:hypothetical protein [Endozoicomonas ascidiicola]|uniref:hypothetical protein n=1 Tax=Endozoicomonas ascidiicola TaxID=1698521 RepID=UPI000836FC13|nr:hypothetical protein [Endozoicomonas ascidiicola]
MSIDNQVSLGGIDAFKFAWKKENKSCFIVKLVKSTWAGIQGTFCGYKVALVQVKNYLPEVYEKLVKDVPLGARKITVAIRDSSCSFRSEQPYGNKGEAHLTYIEGIFTGRTYYGNLSPREKVPCSDYPKGLLQAVNALPGGIKKGVTVWKQEAKLTSDNSDNIIYEVRYMVEVNNKLYFAKTSEAAGKAKEVDALRKDAKKRACNELAANLSSLKREFRVLDHPTMDGRLEIKTTSSSCIVRLDNQKILDLYGTDAREDALDALDDWLNSIAHFSIPHQRILGINKSTFSDYQLMLNGQPYGKNFLRFQDLCYDTKKLKREAFGWDKM